MSLNRLVRGRKQEKVNRVLIRSYSICSVICSVVAPAKLEITCIAALDLVPRTSSGNDSHRDRCRTGALREQSSSVSASGGSIRQATTTP